MATLEQFGVLLEIQAQSYRLVRNMRSNATDYLARAAAVGADPVKLSALMKADAAAFLVRLQTYTDAVTRNQTLVSNALAIIGVTLAQAATLRDTLVAVCQHTQAATLTTLQACTDEANLILSTVPAYDGLF